MKNTLHFTFLRTLIVFAFGLFFNVASGQYFVDFESNSAGSNYNPGNISLSGIQWGFTQALIGNLSSDFKNGNNSVRLRGYNNTKIVMNSDKQNGAGVISFVYAKYDGSDSTVSYAVEYSIDGGANWVLVNTFTPASTLPTTFSQNINITGNIRFQIRHNSGGNTSTNRRGNIDDISITDYVVIQAPPVVTSETFVGIYNTSFNHQVVASGVPTSYQVTSGTLPTGIVLDGVTGVLSGTPTVVGNFSVQISATNGFGEGSSAQIDFDIQKANQTLSIADQSVLLGAPASSLPATTVEGLALNYVSSNSTVASVTGISIAYGQAGTAGITANSAGNQFYNPFTTTFNVTVVDPNAIPCFSEDFSSAGGNNTSTGGSSNVWPGNDNFPSPNNSVAYEGGGAIRLGSGSSSGKLTSKQLGNLTGSLRVEFDVKGWTNVEGTINVVLGGVTKNFVYTARMSNSFESAQLDFENVSANSVLVIETSNGRAFIDNVSVCIIPASETSTTWSGTAWSNEVPTNTSDAIIAGDYNTATNGTFTAKSLTVNSGVFTVASGTSVTVENAVTSAGATNFIVKSNANLIQTSSAANTGAITVERESAQLVRLDHTLWSSPVATQKLFAFSPNTLTNRFYTYATATNNYVNTGLSATTDFTVGKGYGVRAPNDHSTTPATWMGTFAGVPNNGDVSFTLTNVGEAFNLVGNPYPSVVDGAAFVAANSTRINGTLYFYAHTLTMNEQGAFPAGTNYALWNATGQTAAAPGTSGVPALVPNGKIQVGQGFLVKSTNSSALVFNNTMREANTGNQFFRTAPSVQATSEAEKHRLWLNLTNAEGTTFNQILVGYVAGATQEVDNLFDGLSFGNEGSALSSRLSNEDYTIQGRALPFNAADVVPLGFKAVTSGNYTISLSDMDGVFAADQNVFLKDNTDGTINNIKIAPYAFTAEAGTFNNRFEVVYQSTLGTPELTFDSSSVVAYIKEAQLNIQTKGNSMKTVSVYDVRGRLLFSKSDINAADFVVQGLAAQNQVLLVQVTAENGEVATVKVIF